MELTSAQQKVLDALTQELPPAVAIIGERQVGKRTVAKAIRDHYQVVDSDYLFFPTFDVGRAQALLDIHGYRPVGPFRLAVIRVWSSMSLDAVLGVLEAGYDDVKIILLAEPGVLPESVLSRCAVHVLPALSLDEVQRVVSGKVRSPAMAQKVATTSSGSIPIVSDYVEDEEAKGVVVSAVKAFSSRDRAALEDLADEWTERHTDLLVEWCYESASSSWRKFSPDDVSYDSHRLPLTILMHLRETVRPQLTVRGSLVAAWEDYHGQS